MENIQANASKEIQSEMQRNMGAEAVKAIRLKKIEIVDCKLDMRLYKKTNLGYSLEEHHVTD